MKAPTKKTPTLRKLKLNRDSLTLDDEVLASVSGGGNAKPPKIPPNIEIQPEPHPFYTGKQKLYGTDDRVKAFTKRYY